ncbi:MAG: M28 family peptidase [Atopobiaceae bacterium]|nr:M28 family peptidase [Atopobiaceae bacterium]
MSKTHEYLNYLDEQIGIAPANSQEELQAAQTISEVMADHGVNPEIEEFSTPTGAQTAKSVVTLAMLLGLIFAGFGGIIGFVGVVVAIACAVLLLMIHAGRTPFAKMGSVVQSQNVVAFHAQTGSKVMKGNRPIIIVAHYDTPRVNPMVANKGMARFYARAYAIRVYCLYGVAIASFVQLLGFLPPVVRRVFWFLGILAALVPALLAISDIATRFGDCTDGANDNKAAVAALLSILNNVRPGADVALDAEAVRLQQEEEERAREAARRAREEEEAAAAAAEAEAKAKAEAERLARYKRHGKVTIEALGMLPAGCPIVYEDPHVELEPKEQKEETAETPASTEPESNEAVPEEAAAAPAPEAAEAEPEKAGAPAEEEKPADKTLKKPSIGGLFSRVRHSLESDKGYDDEEPKPEPADEDAADKTLVRPKEEEAPAAEEAPASEEPEDDEATTTFERLPEDLGETPAQAPIETESVYKPAESEESPYQGQTFADRQKRLWPKVMDAEWEPIDTVTPAGMAPDEPPSAATSVGEPRPRSEASDAGEKKDEEGESGDGDVPLAEPETGDIHEEENIEAPEPEAPAPAEEPAAAEEPAPEEADDETAAPAEEEAVAAPAALSEPKNEGEPSEPEPATPVQETAEAPAPVEPEPEAAVPAEPEAPAAAEPAPAPAHADEAEYLAHRSEDIASYVDSIFAEEIQAAQGLGTDHAPAPSEAPAAPAAQEPEPAPAKPGPDDSAVMAALASLDTMPQAKDYAPAAEEAAAPEPETPAPRNLGKHLADITPAVDLADIKDVSSPEEDASEVPEPAEPVAEESVSEPESEETVHASWEEDPFAHISKSTPVDAVFEEIEEEAEEEALSDYAPEEETAETSEADTEEEAEEPQAAAPEEVPAQPEEDEPAALESEPEPSAPAFEPEPAEAEEMPAEPEASVPEDDGEAAPEDAASQSDASDAAPIVNEEPEGHPEEAAAEESEPEAETHKEEPAAEQQEDAEEDPSAPDEMDYLPKAPRPLYPSVMDAEAIEVIEEEPEPVEGPEPEEAEQPEEAAATEPVSEAEAESESAPELEPEAVSEEEPEETYEPEPESEPAAVSEPEPEPAEAPQPEAGEASEAEPEPEPVLPAEEPAPVQEAEPEAEAAPAPIEEEAAEPEDAAGDTAAMPVSVPEPEMSEEEPAPAAPVAEEPAEEDVAAAESEEPASEPAEEAAAPAEETSEAEETDAPVLPQNFQLDMDDVTPEDPDIAPKDLSGVVTEAEDMEEPEPAPREKPQMPDDPEWGKTSFKPAISQMARRVILNDLPDPSQHSIDPFGSGSIASQPMQIPEGQQSMPKKPEQGTFDVITPESLDRIAKESHQEKKHHHFGRHGGKGRHFTEAPVREDHETGIHGSTSARPHHGSNHGWKGGATPKDELRLPQLDLADDGPESHGYELDPERAEAVRAQAAADAAAQAQAEAEARAQAAEQEAAARSQQVSEEELRDAVLSMNDEDLISHDIWFVATGASELDHAGIKAFLDAHKQDIRGAFLIDLDCVGAGDPTVLVEEGHDNPKRADRRLVRMFQNIAQDFGLPLGRARYSIGETDATTALRRHIRSVTIMGMDENGLPAFSHTLDDVPENVNGDQVADIVEMVTELIRQS